MGRFHTGYLRHQRIFAAYDGDTPRAFVSFHTTGGQWTLDLMRHADDVPTGTMHALVCAAIDAARRCGVRTLSLACVPDPEPHLPFTQHALDHCAGLRRFKAAFAPQWQPRYFCAPTKLHLTVMALGLAHAIHRPAPLPRPNPAQADDEDYSFAPAPVPCEARQAP